MKVVAPVQECMEELVSSIETINDVMHHLVNATVEKSTVASPSVCTTTFTVGGISVETIAPPADKRHSLVRESSAIINHMKEMNTRWDPSGPRSHTAAVRKRSKKNKKPLPAKATKLKHRPSTAPAHEPDRNQLELERKPDRAYTLHRARLRRREKSVKLVELQRQNGAIGLRGLLQELRYRNGSTGRQRTSVVHIERPLMHTLKECFFEPPSTTVLLGAALAFEALVEDKTSHIEIRTRLVLDAAGTAAQSMDLLSERNQRDPNVKNALGVGWRIMRALVSAIGRLTDDDFGNSNKHNRRFCLEQGGLVILVRAVASDLWASMCRKMQRHSLKHMTNKDQWLPQWRNQHSPSGDVSNQQDEDGSLLNGWNTKHKQWGGKDKTSNSRRNNRSNSNNGNTKSNNYQNKNRFRTRPSTVAVERVGEYGLLGMHDNTKKSERPCTTSIVQKNKEKRKSGRRGTNERSPKKSKKKRNTAGTTKRTKTIPFSKDKEGKVLKKQTQLDAVRLLTIWAADDALRPLLAIGRVLEAALLVVGGRQKQLQALDNEGKGRPLTMGRPKYTGTELQIAANHLLLSFTQADFEAMESADRRQAIGRYAMEADVKLTKILLPATKNNQKHAGLTQRLPPRSPIVTQKLSSPFSQTQQPCSSMAPCSTTNGTRRGTHPTNVFGRSSGPPVPISILDMSGAPLAADGDRSKRPHGDHIAVWETFREGMLNAEVRARTRQLWRDEIEFRGILDERDQRLEEAIKHSRKLNLQYNEKKIYKNRLQRVQHLCSPAGRIQEARRMHGLGWKDPREEWNGVDPGVRRKLLGMEPVERVEPKHTYFPRATEVAPDPTPIVSITQPDYFGRCADDGGRAWWENLVVKKKRPTREELELLPYDISKDVEQLCPTVPAVFFDAINNSETRQDENMETFLKKRNETNYTIEKTTVKELPNPTISATPQHTENQFLIPVLRPSTAPAPATDGHSEQFDIHFDTGRPQTVHRTHGGLS